MSAEDVAAMEAAETVAVAAPAGRGGLLGVESGQFELVAPSSFLVIPAPPSSARLRTFRIGTINAKDRYLAASMGSALRMDTYAVIEQWTVEQRRMVNEMVLACTRQQLDQNLAGNALSQLIFTLRLGLGRILRLGHGCGDFEELAAEDIFPDAIQRVIVVGTNLAFPIARDVIADALHIEKDIILGFDQLPVHSICEEIRIVDLKEAWAGLSDTLHFQASIERLGMHPELLKRLGDGKGCGKNLYFFFDSSQHLLGFPSSAASLATVP